MSDKIKKIYSSIKNSDFASFYQYYEEDENIIYLKNNTNNLLFYCLEKKSLAIFNFIVSKDKSLLMQKNIDGNNCLTYLIEKSAIKPLEYFLSHSLLKDEFSSTIDSHGNNLLAISLLKGEEYFNIYEKYLYDPAHIEDFNFEEQTMSHLICIKNAEYAKHLLRSSDFNEPDRKGITPFLMACRHSSYELFKTVADKSDIHIKTPLGTHALHFCAYSGDVQKAQYLSSKGFNKHEKNTYGYSPLLIALKEKHFGLAVELIKKAQNITLEETFLIIRACDKTPELLDSILMKPALFERCLDNKENIFKFLSYVYYYLPEEKLKEHELVINTIADDKGKLEDSIELLNSLYFSSIAGRRDYFYKTNYLHKKYGWSEINGNSFNNFSRFYPCGFIYALHQLPKTQFESLIKQSDILASISNTDKIILKLLCINKGVKTAPDHTFSKIDRDFLKTDAIYIKSLLEKTSYEKYANHLSFFENMSFEKELSSFISEKIACGILSHCEPLEEFKRVYRNTSSAFLKKEIYLKMVDSLLSQEAPSALEAIFYNKPAIIEASLNKILLNTPHSFKNIAHIEKHPFINIEPVSCLSYLKSQNFDEKSLFIIDKSKDFIMYLKDYNLEKEDISIHFIEKVRRQSLNDPILCLRFLEYGYHHLNIACNSYCQYIDALPLKEKKEILEISLKGYLKSNGCNTSLYEELEKRYIRHFSRKSLESHILNHAQIDILMNYPLINPFDAQCMKSDSNISGLIKFSQNIKQYAQIPEFRAYALEKFIASGRNNLFEMAEIISIDTSHDPKLYSIVIEKISCQTAGQSIESIVEDMLFHKSEEIARMVVQCENIMDILAPHQKSYVMAERLGSELNIKKETVKKTKI